MTQPYALFLADILEDAGKPADIAEKAAVELRRLHAELERCKQVCAATSEAWREEAALAEPVEPTPTFHVEPLKWGCGVCGIGADGKAYGYVCPRLDCPTKVSCGVAV